MGTIDCPGAHPSLLCGRGCGAAGDSVAVRFVAIPVDARLAGVRRRVSVAATAAGKDDGGDAAEDVLAQDLFYEHAELDLHTQATEVQLKYAFKFVALRPGTTVFKAGYGPPGATAWVQKLKVVVVPPSY